MERIMRIVASLCAIVLLISAQGAARAQTIANCDQYADVALQQFFDGRRAACQLAGPEWHDRGADGWVTSAHLGEC
jgi:hypothetical protein